MSPVIFKQRKPKHYKPDLYLGQLACIETKESTKSSSGFMQVWTFKATVAGRPEDITVITSDSIGQKSKARPFMIALLGRDINPDEEISSAMLIGKRVRLVVSDYALPDGTVTSRVTGMLPAEK